METIYFVSLCASAMYVVIKFAEHKYRPADPDEKKTKVLLKDAVIVMTVTLISFFLKTQFDTIMNVNTAPSVFVNDPEF